MPDPTEGPQISDLERERLRLSNEIQNQTAIANDPNQSAGDRFDANKRLEKLNDDYRTLLIAMKPSTAASIGDIKQLDDGSWVRINPDNTVVRLNIPVTQKPQTVDQITVPGAGGRIFRIDPSNPTGDLIPATPASADETLKQQQIKEREYNQQLTGHYATDQELQDYNIKLQKMGVDKAAEARTQAEFEANQKRLDAAEARTAGLYPGTVAQQGATLAGTQATTAGTQASTAATLGAEQRAQAKFPGDLAQANATLAGTEAGTARTNQQILQGNAPTVQAPPTGMYQWQRNPNTGAITQTGLNPEYVPKTMADVNARVGQIQALMQAKNDDIQRRVASKEITADQGLSEFSQWYAQNVQPQQSAIQAAQQEAIFNQAKDAATARQSALTAALSAGTQARENWTAANVNRVGPGWAAANAAASRGDFAALGAIPDATTYTAPDINQTAPAAVQDALKYISPAAAMGAGMPMPNYQNVNIGQALAPSQYAFGGAPAGGTRQLNLAGAAGPITVQNAGASAAAPPGQDSLSALPFDQWLSEWQGRQAEDTRQQQLAQGIYQYGG